MEEVEFGRYRLIEEVGSGGMGKVYRARDTVLPRDVAIKVLPADRAEEPGYQDRFRREAHIAARLTEPHIVAIYDAGEIDGRLFLVMPVIGGIDLGRWLERHQRMAAPLAVRVIEQLARALDAAHAVGLVHRDVKPSNALMTPQEHVYLIDFGIAHDAAATKLTATGSLLGSLPYMAPERLLTSKSDARSDVYSLACTFYECLTGQRPYADDVVIAGHLSGDPPKPSAVSADISPGFDDVIARGMAKDPEQRYQTAGQLAAAAREVLDSATATESLQSAPAIDKPAVKLPKAEHASLPPVPPDFHRAETVAAEHASGLNFVRPPARAEPAPAKGRPIEPARPRRKTSIAIGVVLIAAAVTFAVLAFLQVQSNYVCTQRWRDYPRCGYGGITWVGPFPVGWSSFLQPYVQTALVAALLTAGIFALRRYRWWMYVLVPIAGLFAWQIFATHRREWDNNYFAFLVCVIVATAVCVLIAWAITLVVKRSRAAAARGPRTAGEVPRLHP